MKKGFSLIELLAVITILGIILVMVVPRVIKVIDDSKSSSQKESVELYGRAVDNAVINYYIKYPDADEVSVKQLKDENLIKYKGDKVECNYFQVVNRKVYLSECTVDGNPVDYTYGTVEVENPVLTKGLIPVIYKDNNWVVIDEENKDWYDYENQKWANAVVLKNGVTKNVGDTVLVDGTEAVMMYVWIPRYEYNYKKLETELSDEEKKTPPAIEINFISKDTTTPSSDNYKVHPAFTFGTEEKSGMWVGKFELSHTTKSLGTGTSTSDYNAANLNCTTDTCIETQYLRVLPNVPSLRYNDVSNFFYAIKGIANTFGLSNTDTHMMKNSEWGAVAYLSQSKYGKYGNSDYDNKYKEVYQNKSDTFITGSSNGTPSQSDSRSGGQCAYNDMQDLGKDTNNYKMGQCGPGASTTGNIYGVYDMSGGTWEYVMGAYGTDNNPTIGSSGFSPDPNVFTNGTIDSKYYDIYKTSTANTACGENEVCYGHGLSETSGWNGDYADMVTSSDSWIVRGGTANDNYAAGLFGFRDANGTRSSNSSARVVGFAK